MIPHSVVRQLVFSFDEAVGSVWGDCNESGEKIIFLPGPLRIMLFRRISSSADGCRFSLWNLQFVLRGTGIKRNRLLLKCPAGSARGSFLLHLDPRLWNRFRREHCSSAQNHQKSTIAACSPVDLAKRESKHADAERDPRAVNGIVLNHLQPGISCFRRLSEQLDFKSSFYHLPDGDRSGGIPADCDGACCSPETDCGPSD